MVPAGDRRDARRGGGVIGLIGSEIGGFLGPNAIGILFILAGVTTMLPSHWRVSLALLVPAFVATSAALVGGVALHPVYHVQLTSPAALKALGVDLLTFLALGGFTVFGAIASGRPRTPSRTCAASDATGSRRASAQAA